MRQRRSGLLLPCAILVLTSACGGGGGGGGGNPPPPPPPPPQRAGTVQFEAGSVSVDESAGTASIALSRTDGSDGVVSVTVTSGDGSATAGQDYTALSTTVSFAAGDASAKTLTVLISDDDAGEADETLSLTLSAPTGGAIVGGNAIATLTIRDDDPLVAPQIEVRASDIKHLSFTWTSVPGATSYRLLQDPDGVSGFVPMGGDLAADATSATLEVAVHRQDWVNARYRLEACNANGCSASGQISAVDAMLQVIGYFKASDNEPGDILGASVALSADGNTLAVGAPFEDSSATGVGGNEADNSASAAGAVHVFTRAGTQWVQQAYVKASNTESNDNFGEALALSADGNTLAVGTPREESDATGVDGDQTDNSAGNAGAVYVFTRTGTQWSQQAYLKASNTESTDQFGRSVALSADGNLLAVGAPGEDSSARVGGNQADNSALDAGAVYVFTRAGTQWSQQAYVKASNTESLDQFGTSVALSADGSTLAVGAPFEDSSATGVGGNQADNSADESGAAYVFTRAGTQWSQQAYVKASNTETGDGFGLSLTLSADGNTLAVGAFSEDSDAKGVGGDQADNSASTSGAVYVFARAGTQWSQQAYVKASNTETGDGFGAALVGAGATGVLIGRSVALSADGNTLAVGAPREASNATGVDGAQTDNSAPAAGAVHVFTRAGTQWSQQAYVKASNTEISDSFGAFLALSGDGNTLAVGAPFEASNATGVDGDQTDNSAPLAGAVYLY